MQTATALCHRFPEPLAEELDGDLWGRPSDRLANFLGSIGQTVRVDVDANAAADTPHVFTRFQSSDALFEIMAAVRTLKFDDVGIDICHRPSLVLFAGPPGWIDSASLPPPNTILRQESAFSVLPFEHRSGRKTLFFYV
jgi:hypothetical protein